MNIEFLIIIFLALLIFVAVFGIARASDKIILNMKLKKIDKINDDFIATVSHQLRTPLTVIGGYAEILKGEVNLSKEGRENILKINNAVSHLNDLVNDILDVSKIETGKKIFNLEKINPVPIVHNVISNLERLAKSKSLKLEVEVFSTADINVDPTHLKQALKNVIKNGIKYTKTGSVIVKINTEGSDLLISVSDTGKGIAEKDIEKVFDKFYKDDGKDSSGAGLGLWIAKQIVIKMRGKINVKSKENSGSTFVFRFPIAL